VASLESKVSLYVEAKIVSWDTTGWRLNFDSTHHSGQITLRTAPTCLKGFTSSNFHPWIWWLHKICYKSKIMWILLPLFPCNIPCIFFYVILVIHLFCLTFNKKIIKLLIGLRFEHGWLFLNVALVSQRSNVRGLWNATNCICLVDFMTFSIATQILLVYNVQL